MSYNIFLELVGNVHYNLISFNMLADKPGAGVVLTPRQLRRAYWGRTRVINLNQHTTSLACMSIKVISSTGFFIDIMGHACPGMSITLRRL